MLTDQLFSTPPIDNLFSAQSELRFMGQFEGALAQAQAGLGMIPASAGAVIERVCLETDWDPETIVQQTRLAGNPAIPFVKVLRQRVSQQDAEAATYVHWGATSQDVIDTALMLQLKQAFVWISQDLVKLQQLLAQLAQKHRDTPMVGRTLLQQARPISFGYKVAGWLAPLIRTARRLDELSERNLVLQLGGAVGTLAGLGERGIDVSVRVARQLGLKLPEMPWHTQRDHVVEIGSALGMLNGNLGKMAKDIILLMQTEIAEVQEVAAEGKGGSSAMPHKRNPVSSTWMVAITNRTPALVSSLLSGMVQEHERAAGAWHAEWAVVRELVMLTASNLCHGNDLVAGLEVDVGRMRQHIELTNGLIFAEDVTVALAPKIGKMAAQTLLEEACKQALAERVHLKDYLVQKTEVVRWLDNRQLDELFDPQRALGLSGEWVDRVMKQVK